MPLHGILAAGATPKSKVRSFVEVDARFVEVDARGSRSLSIGDQETAISPGHRETLYSRSRNGQLVIEGTGGSGRGSGHRIAFAPL